MITKIKAVKPSKLRSVSVIVVLMAALSCTLSSLCFVCFVSILRNCDVFVALESELESILRPIERKLQY